MAMFRADNVQAVAGLDPSSRLNQGRSVTRMAFLNST